MGEYIGSLDGRLDTRLQEFEDKLVSYSDQNCNSLRTKMWKQFESVSDKIQSEVDLQNQLRTSLEK